MFRSPSNSKQTPLHIDNLSAATENRVSTSVLEFMVICLCNCDVTCLRLLAYDWSIMLNEFIPAACLVTCYTTPLYYASKNY